jgi:hypothetical protein
MVSGAGSGNDFGPESAYGCIDSHSTATSPVGQLCFGIEIRATNGQDAMWSIRKYSITTN